MEIATFGPSTGWAGRAITFDSGQFQLADHGPITAADVLQYDRQGQLVWAYDGLREWVTQQVGPAAQPPGPTASMMGAAVDGAVGQPGQKKGGFPAWAIVLIVVLSVIALVVAVLVGIVVRDAENDKIREAATKESMYSILVGVQSYAVDHNDLYPDPSLVRQGALINEADGYGYVDIWPANPYTGLPMSPGTGPGDFTYMQTPDGGFQLIGYGKDGAVITLP